MSNVAPRAMQRCLRMCVAEAHGYDSSALGEVQPNRRACGAPILGPDLAPQLSPHLAPLVRMVEIDSQRCHPPMTRTEQPT
jgi:hypothetical protein